MSCKDYLPTAVVIDLDADEDNDVLELADYDNKIILFRGDGNARTLRLRLPRPTAPVTYTVHMRSEYRHYIYLTRFYSKDPWDHDEYSNQHVLASGSGVTLELMWMAEHDYYLVLTETYV